LLAVASRRGYNPGWAFNVYNSRKAKSFQEAVV